MKMSTRWAFVVLWLLSLMVVAQWSGRAQGTPAVGREVRFLQSDSTITGHKGVLVANFDGQWLPVTLDTMPDGNTLRRKLAPNER